MTSDANFTGTLPVPPDLGPPEPSSTTDSGGKAADLKDSARQQASQVGSAATSAASDTVSTAKDQIGNVAQEAAGHARDLWAQASSDIGEQATQQTQRLTANIRQLADHLNGMADNGESGSPAQSLVREAGQRAHGVAQYLDGRQPGDFVNDLQQFGRRRPGAFLLGAAVAGFLAGRLVKATKNAEPSSNQTSAERGTRVVDDPYAAPQIDLRAEGAALSPVPPTTMTPVLADDGLSMPAGGDLR